MEIHKTKGVIDNEKGIVTYMCEFCDYHVIFWLHESKIKTISHGNMNARHSGSASLLPKGFLDVNFDANIFKGVEPLSKNTPNDN